ncbi:unnamed protein product [Caenorhabditis bovis]|uniref:RPA43 OB domain-containing protein n=1 Tax=Caenorhabditis bovis TaxID=2654633 RepID=A0A8S1EZV7_9PELO|nr:unnamed protein product [Caenorhabditis bovis]
MGKRRSSNQVKVEDVEETVEVPKKKLKNDAEQDEGKAYRFRKGGQNIIQKQNKESTTCFMSYEDGLSRIKTEKMEGNKSSGIVHQKQLRHVSLPHHMSGQTAMKQALRFITRNTVGRYKKESKGIIVAVGEIEIASPPRVIADQFVFHLDILINQIVFKPKKGDQYEAIVRHVDNDMIIGLVMDMITIQVRRNDKINKDDVDVDDIIRVNYAGMVIKRSLCLLQGNYVELVKKIKKEDKGSNNHITFNEESEAAAFSGVKKQEEPVDSYSE